MSGAAAHDPPRLERIDLHDGWELQAQSPGAIASPAELSDAGDWHTASVPGTVAQSLGHPLETPGDFDTRDWWYRKRFALTPRAGARYVLDLGGLATLCRVWLNGTLILDSHNMFVGHRLEVTTHLRASNELVMGFASLHEALKAKRPRPRWKTALVEQQNLRWFRTTLLGRIAGWTPPVTAVGPWRAVRLECHAGPLPVGLTVTASLSDGAGQVSVRGALEIGDGPPVEAARLRIGTETLAVALSGLTGAVTLAADSRLPHAVPWWPHTHGTPHLYEWALELHQGGDWRPLQRGRLGFRSLAMDLDQGPSLSVNGTPVFCRGACWTSADMRTLRAEGAPLRRFLTLARDAGINMLRIGGTMVYESDEFYALCDELGILVWQDFMFANMDYPCEEPAFAATVEAELIHQLGRLHAHPCVAVYCGGSEVAQQAAMLGRPAAEWSNTLFAETLPQACARLHPGVPYVPSSPWGGALPFHVGRGIAHYYGVGAYRRPLSDVKHAGVRFTTESLGFSNVPERATIDLIHDGAALPPHHPRWKARLPRDSGPGWDFEDIRDFYLAQLFGVDPVALRSVDVDRYLALSRVVTGEVLSRVFAEWRAPANPCAGGLVWFYQDLWPGAGWGIVDSTGRPKAVYWYLKRAWARRAVRFTDEGLDGLNIVVLNEAPEPLHARIELRLYQGGRLLAGSAESDVDVAARGTAVLQADRLIGHFTDMTNAYRFGPPKFDVVSVRLSGADGLISEDHYFPAGHGLPVRPEGALSAQSTWLADGRVSVTLRSHGFLQAVNISCSDFEPDDNYFHLLPEQDKTLILMPNKPGITRFKAAVGALNLAEEITVRAQA